MKKRILREIAAFAYGTTGLFLIISLFSYSAFDPTFYPFTNYPVNSVPQNLGGYAGSFLAGFLLNVFGWPAFLFPVALFFYAYQTYQKEEVVPPERVVFVCLAVIIAGGLLGLLANPVILENLTPSGRNFASFPAGGILGYFLAEHGSNLFGKTGLAIILLAGLVVLLSVTFNIPLSRFKPKLQFESTSRPALKKKEPLIKESVFVPATKLEAPSVNSSKIRARKERNEKTEEIPTAVTPVSTSFTLPTPDILSPVVAEEQAHLDLDRYRSVIEDTIADFGIMVKVVECNQGPTITMFELELSPGVMPQRIVSLSDNLAMALRATSVRVVPLPGKSTLGVEVPNPKMSIVQMSEIISAPEFIQHRSKLALALGKDTLGRPLVADLRNMPHLLIAGATGSGKSVCLNSLLISLLFRTTPEETQFLLIDPKMVEMTIYRDIPHLLLPVITETKSAIEALKWMVGEMERRYRLFSQNNARSIDIYNSRDVERIPYIVVVVDELADLITVARTEVELSIIRLSQLARSAGIHLIIATQRPSVNVITGVIKANFPVRIAFQVASKVDSRTILDANGAEKLLGRGDMLYLSPTGLHPIRAQGCYLPDSEIEKVSEFWKKQGKGPTYDLDFIRESNGEEGSEQFAGEDPLFDEAVQIVLTHQSASISLLQRKLKIGFNRAARLIEEMESQGIVGTYRDGKPREILR
ncbi:MAG: DNA translocase FtsK 4TM domain-containing protein [Candidatus Omnitrophota bacterium]|nr:DNA translocase FtsK 4TM domain-containing protein [Candidatus Omnitrophota bacterium]